VLSEDLIKSIQQILILGRGDQGRLEYILDLLLKGKQLPDSDTKYLQIMIPYYLSPKDSESFHKNVDSTFEQLHNEIMKLTEEMKKFQRKGFEKYVGRKAILFFVTAFVGWNVLQTYAQPYLSDYISNDILRYLYPLNMAANFFNYAPVVWLVFLILVISWPFIGAIHLTKFIETRKISNNSH
jgi:hypothetical protein